MQKWSTISPFLPLMSCTKFLRTPWDTTNSYLASTPLGCLYMFVYVCHLYFEIFLPSLDMNDMNGYSGCHLVSIGIVQPQRLLSPTSPNLGTRGCHSTCQSSGQWRCNFWWGCVLGQTMPQDIHRTKMHERAKSFSCDMLQLKTNMTDSKTWKLNKADHKMSQGMFQILIWSRGCDSKQLIPVKSVHLCSQLHDQSDQDSSSMDTCNRCNVALQVQSALDSFQHLLLLQYLWSIFKTL